MRLKSSLFLKFLLMFIFSQLLIASEQKRSQHMTLADIALENLELKKQKDKKNKTNPNFAVQPSTTHLQKISTRGDFDLLALKLESELGQQQLVKMVYDRRDSKNPQVQFFNTNTYSYHIEFTLAHLNWTGSGGEFNHNYEENGEGRIFNLATLALSPRKLQNGKTEFLLEIWNGDSLSGAFLKELYDAVNDSLTDFPNAVLTFHPLSDLHEANVKALNDPIPYVINDDLYEGKEYWPLSRYDAVGTVKIIEEVTEDILKTIEPSDIVVFLKDVPNEIGFVAGVVTQSFQTPLSHINIKSKNRKTANLSHKRALELFGPYNGQFISLEVGADKPNIVSLNHLSPAEQAEKLKIFWESRRIKLNQEIEAIKIDQSNPKEYEFVDLRSVYKKLPNKAQHTQVIQKVGAKAANIGLLNYMASPLKERFQIEVPPALGLPFSFYDRFLQGRVTDKSGQFVTLENYIKDRINNSGLAVPGTIKRRSLVEPVLEEIRQKFQEVAIPRDFFDIFEKAIFDSTNTNTPIHITKKIPRIRLRSSTNSEDLEGFTGAGLYESEGINLYKRHKDKKGYKMDEPRSWKKIKKSLEEKIRLIYAGVWNTRAYMEREWFGLDGQQHLRVMAALAVHQAFPSYIDYGIVNEHANGVVATRNIYNQQNHGGVDEIYINCQHWDLAVTNPPTQEDLEDWQEFGHTTGTDPIPYRTEESVVTAFANDPTVHNRPDVFRWWFAQKLKASSVNSRKPVLNDDSGNIDDYALMETRRLAGAFYYLEKKMAQVYGRRLKDYDIEGEWKILGDKRTIMIKQMREFPQPGKL